MTINNRVVWSEGLFLRPQHFQQQERALERYIEIRAAAVRSNGWGFTELELERDLLATGKLAVRRARGVLPDGTPFSIPDDDPVPPALEVPPNTRDRTAFLALPLRRAGAVDVAAPEMRGRHALSAWRDRGPGQRRRDRRTRADGGRLRQRAPAARQRSDERILVHPDGAHHRVQGRWSGHAR
jgi:type VI secretion system ImpJ/VasE family protein